MTNEPKKVETETDHSETQAESPSPTPSDRKNAPKTVDVLDNLVYSGGYDRDLQEILGNPGAVPQMLQDGRDLRTDLSRICFVRQKKRTPIKSRRAQVAIEQCEILHCNSIDVIGSRAFKVGALLILGMKKRLYESKRRFDSYN